MGEATSTRGRRFLGQVSLAVVALVAFAAWGLRIVWQVGELRERLEANVGVVLAAERMRGMLLDPDDASLEVDAAVQEIDAVLAATAALAEEAPPDSVLMAAVEELAREMEGVRPVVVERGLAGPRMGPHRNLLTRHLTLALNQLRRSNSELSRELGKHWTSLYSLFAVAMFLAMLNLLALWVAYRRGVRLDEAHADLRRRALRDGLTGVWNRHAIIAHITREIARARRTGQPLSAVMVDADHFKKINDTHGHRAGDEVLRELAARLEQSVRIYDQVGRYGGEEFVAVLSGCAGLEAQIVAERMRKKVMGTPIRTVGQALEVTVSIGVAGGHMSDGCTPERLLQAADAALYEAKRSGRNRVVLQSHMGCDEPTGESPEPSPGAAPDPSSGGADDRPAG